jgi:AcrR family transcriptional regulator
MLSHHFGSKEGLWVAIVEEVERRQLRATVEAAPRGNASFADAMRTRWRHVSDPSLWPIERLFFEVYAQALHGRSATSGFLDGVVESWLGPVTEIGEAIGLSHDDAGRSRVSGSRSRAACCSTSWRRETVTASTRRWNGGSRAPPARSTNDAGWAHPAAVVLPPLMTVLARD